MDSDGPMPDSANHPSAAAAQALGPRPCYVEPAPLSDVMFDQLEYLVAHTSSQCSPGCPDCNRLEQVKKWLLAPFRPARVFSPGS